MAAGYAGSDQFPGARIHLCKLADLQIRDCEVSGLKIVDCYGSEVYLGGVLGEEAPHPRYAVRDFTSTTDAAGGNVGSMASWNDAVIEQFRANGGVLGGHWEGKTTLLLHTPGRKTGKVTVSPLVAAPHGDAYVVCGTAGGAPEDPQWVANLEALDGPVTIELGSKTLEARHRVVRPDREEDWAELYRVWREYWPDAADYETKTDRKFPVAVITP